MIGNSEMALITEDTVIQYFTPIKKWESIKCNVVKVDYWSYWQNKQKHLEQYGENQAYILQTVVDNKHKSKFVPIVSVHYDEERYYMNDITFFIFDFVGNFYVSNCISPKVANAKSCYNYLNYIRVSRSSDPI